MSHTDRLGSACFTARGTVALRLHESSLLAAQAAAEKQAAIASVAGEDGGHEHTLAAERRRHAADTRALRMKLAVAGARCDALEVRREGTLVRGHDSFPQPSRNAQSTPGGDVAHKDSTRRCIVAEELR